MRTYVGVMRGTLIDLTRHCMWADQEIWICAEEAADFLNDPALLARFHHIHLVQYAFVSLVRGEEVDPHRGEDLTASALREWGQGLAITLFELARLIPDAELTEHFDVPWFRNPPIVLSRGEALLQACLHSVHHRAQIASRIRDIGGEPPQIDYIYWIWKGRPGPSLPGD